MTVAHDAFSERSAFTTLTTAEFQHVPVGTPRGVAVYIVQSGSSADQISGITYGGVAMTRVADAQDTVTENAFTYAYFLGASIPTGAQTVSISADGTSSPKKPWCVSVTAAADTEIAAFNIAEENQADPQVALDSGADTAQRYVALFSGLPNTTDLADFAVQTRLDDNDFGAGVAVISRETTPASGSVTLGYTAATDDVALVGIAIDEGGAAPATQVHVIVAGV
jgi:hypothetical protein